MTVTADHRKIFRAVISWISVDVVNLDREVRYVTDAACVKIVHQERYINRRRNSNPI